MTSINYTLSDYAQKKLASTCTHKLLLEKDGQYYWGIYNGLSFWGHVEYNGKFVQTLYSGSEYIDDEYVTYDFAPVDFIEGGYNIVE